MNKFTFTNKFVFTNKRMLKGAIVKLLLALILLITILKIGLDGFSVYVLYVAVVCIGLIKLNGSPTFEENVATRLEYENGTITICYMNLDRHDKLGRRNENYIIDTKDIKSIDYNDELFKLSIVSKADVKITSKDGEVIEKDYRNTNDYCENVLYLPDDVREPILAMVKNICNESGNLIAKE